MRVVLFVAAIVFPCKCIDEKSLRLPQGSVDPTRGDTKAQLMNLLGVRDMDVQTLKSNAGINGGMWVLRCPSYTADLILKFRAEDPTDPVPEAGQLKMLARMHPGLTKDPDLAFPSMIIAALDSFGRKQGDFIVCRKVPGQMLAELVAIKYSQGDAGKKELYTIFEKVGQQLQAFHGRYGKQHSDFHGANVLVDAANDNRITFVDLSGIGTDIVDNDISHFKESLQLLSRYYPPASFLLDGFEHFRRGYGRSRDTVTTHSRLVPEPPQQKRQALGTTSSNLVRESPQQKQFAPIARASAGQSIFSTQPRKSCSSHSQCRHLSGDCCPLYGDVYLSCCDPGSVPANAPLAQSNVANVFAAVQPVPAAVQPVPAYQLPSVSLPSWSTPPIYAAPGVQHVYYPAGGAFPPPRSPFGTPPAFR